MSDEMPFLRAICESPDDDAPRLIYADWLEEYGEAEQAEFIRVQIKLAELAEHEYRPGEPEYATEQTLRHRESELLADRGRSWCADTVHAIKGPDSKHFDWVATHADFNTTRTVRWTWERGFWHSITCTAADCITYLDAIRERHPVREVRLTDEPNFASSLTHHPEPRVRVMFQNWHGIGETYQSACQDYLSLRWPGITFHLPPMPRRSTMMGYPMTWEPDEFWRPTDEQINDLHEQVRQLRIQAPGGRPDIIIDIDGDRLIAVLAVSEDGGRYVPRRFVDLIDAL